MSTTPLGYEAITVAATAIGLTLDQDLHAEAALIRCETADVRWRDDGTDPSATVGVPLLAGESMTYEGDLARIKFIRQGSTSATVHVSLYRP